MHYGGTSQKHRRSLCLVQLKLIVSEQSWDDDQGFSLQIVFQSSSSYRRILRRGLGVHHRQNVECHWCECHVVPETI